MRAPHAVAIGKQETGMAHLNRWITANARPLSIGRDAADNAPTDFVGACQWKHAAMTEGKHSFAALFRHGLRVKLGSRVKMLGKFF